MTDYGVRSAKHVGMFGSVVIGRFGGKLCCFWVGGCRSILDLFAIVVVVVALRINDRRCPLGGSVISYAN